MASLFVVGVKDFRWSSELDQFLKEYPVSGLALFNSPFDSPDNIWADRDTSLEVVYDFITRVHERVSFLSADQEGGRVRRLRGYYVPLPSAEKIALRYAETRNLAEIERLWTLAAKQMAASWVRLNFAPVCDLRIRDSNEVVGDRSFGYEAQIIKDLAGLFCRSFESVGVRTTLKHFPGHGSSTLDSHQQIALLQKEKHEVFATDRLIFEELAASTSALMTAHIAFPENPEEVFSLSPELIHDFRKGPLANLALITDDLLSMKAVSERKPWVQAYHAPYNYLLLCGDLNASAQAIEETIREAEAHTKDFQAELDLEQRMSFAKFHFRSEWSTSGFKPWAQSIKDYADQAQEILSQWETR